MNDEAQRNEPAVLSCWKDIANYLGKGVRTVQRWEREFDLPVRRPDGIHHKSAVIANARDLDTWLNSRWSGRNGNHRNQRANIAGNRARAEDLIQVSQHLRAAHSLLLEETALAIDTLIENCKELEQLKELRACPPRLWTCNNSKPAFLIRRIANRIA
ncbi:hypothetical protein [Alloacidobacterium sp.]|uniref:hypothetical protein n=1 Tax=Alloacidobacterium sp. TaxID=2951999 RepID=UPI002D7017B5|nr:hypothetical protein [Alloacidobacterium sp.]HYK36543.1 hypothetical protein [Alloacidobacterium sp.]